MGLLFSPPLQMHRKPPQNGAEVYTLGRRLAPAAFVHRKPPRPLQCLSKKVHSEEAIAPPLLTISIISSKQGPPGKKLPHPGLDAAFKMRMRE